jgi:hypothetical protein
MVEGRRSIGLLLLCSISISIAPAGGQNTPAAEDHLKLLSGGVWRKALVEPASPDPAISYQWAHPPNDDAELQLLAREPAEILAQPVSAFQRRKATSPGEFIVQGAGSIRFDFGSECAGWFSFDTDGELSPGVTISISEYNSPATVNGGPAHPEKTIAPVKRNGSWAAIFNSEGYEGVRFAWINVNQSPLRPWKIKNPQLSCRVKPVEYRGSFHSSDPLLDSIWYTGAYTARLNMLSHGLSALLMDRGDRVSWTGDAYVTQRAVLGAFGSAELVKANLLQNAQNSNGIEPYALLWVQSVTDWFMFTGDTNAFRSFVPIALLKLEHARTIWKDPDIAFYGHDERLGFLQTPPANLPEEKAAFRLLFIRVAANFAKALKSAGYLPEAQALEGTVRDCEVGFLESGQDPFGSLEIHAAAEALLAQISTSGDRARLYGREFTNKVERISFSPFNEYTLIDAMALQGHTSEALDDVRSVWGAQVRYGATCFAEVFRTSWAEELPRNGRVPDSVAGYTSLCHGWSSGVVPWMQQNILGVRATSPGFKTFDVEPLITSSLSAFSGTVPTPSGIVHVSWNSSRQLLIARWPEGLHPRFIVPKGVVVHGNVQIETAAREQGIADEGKVVFRACPGERNTKLVAHLGHASIIAEPNSTSRGALDEWKTKLTISGQQPQGRWRGRFGQDGYEMFGVQDGGVRLPSYVLSASHRSPGEVAWADCTEDERALEQEHSSCKKLGALVTRQPDWDKLTESIDVALTGAHEHLITMYFADWECDDRELEISLYDLSRLTMLARPMILRHFGNGVYVSFVATKSFRIRVAHVNGGNAVISALFFDSVG